MMWRPRLVLIPETGPLRLRKKWWVGGRPSRLATCPSGKLRVTPASCALVLSLRHFVPPKRSVLSSMTNAATQTEEEDDMEDAEESCDESGSEPELQDSHDAQAAEDPVMDPRLQEPEPAQCSMRLQDALRPLPLSRQGPTPLDGSAARLLASRRSAAGPLGPAFGSARNVPVPVSLCLTLGHPANAMPALSPRASPALPSHGKETKALVTCVLLTAYRRASAFELARCAQDSVSVAEEPQAQACESASGSEGPSAGEGLRAVRSAAVEMPIALVAGDKGGHQAEDSSLMTRPPPSPCRNLVRQDNDALNNGQRATTPVPAEPVMRVRSQARLDFCEPLAQWAAWFCGEAGAGRFFHLRR